MPGKDGTGPTSKAPVGPRGGRGRMGGNMAAGPGGYCVCPQCQEKAPHRQGVPCSSIVCPKCGAKMVRGQ